MIYDGTSENKVKLPKIPRTGQHRFGNRIRHVTYNLANAKPQWRQTKDSSYQHVLSLLAYPNDVKRNVRKDLTLRKSTKHVAYAFTKCLELTLNYPKIHCRDAVGTFASSVGPQMMVNYDENIVLTLNYHRHLWRRSVKKAEDYDEHP